MGRKLMTAVLGVAFLGVTTAAYAASPPEPYSAPDPVYTPNHDKASVTYYKDGHVEKSSTNKMKSGN